MGIGNVSSTQADAMEDDAAGAVYLDAQNSNDQDVFMDNVEDTTQQQLPTDDTEVCWLQHLDIVSG
jgi:hypothetical protein